MSPHLDVRLHSLRFVAGIFLIALTSACVSVNLPKSSKGKAAGVEFTPPGEPFEVLSSESADRAWKSRSTGATISYLTDCNENPEGLNNFEAESTQSLGEGKILSTGRLEMNGRPAREAKLTGTIEGIPMHLDIVVFRKNGCDYVLTHAARVTSHEITAKEFETFLKGFRTP